MTVRLARCDSDGYPPPAAVRLVSRGLVYALRTVDSLRPIAAAEPHTRLLTAAARESLRPLGLRQKGRSRTWLDDRGWWAGVVEFQPSSWSKGSYLNVGAMWLWREGDHDIRFDLGYRVDGVGGFVEYQSDEQFAPEAERLAATARDEIVRLRAMLPDLDSAISVLSERSTKHGGWPSYNLGVALGLGGRRSEAALRLRDLVADADDPGWWVDAVARAHELAELLEHDPHAFDTDMQRAIQAYRDALKLPPRTDLP